MEKVINRITAGKDDGGVIEDLDLLFPKLLYRYGLYLNERSEINFQIESFGKL
jgi:hypothetical protein